MEKPEPVRCANCNVVLECSNCYVRPKTVDVEKLIKKLKKAECWAHQEHLIRAFAAKTGGK